MVYTIKRTGDAEFELKGTFNEIKAYFDFDEENREDMNNTYVDLLDEFDDNVDYMDDLLETINKINDNGLEYYIESTELEVDGYIEVATHGEGLSHGESISISVDDLTSDEMNRLIENDFIGYKIYLQPSSTGNSIIIESYIDSPICEVVTETEGGLK